MLIFICRRHPLGCQVEKNITISNYACFPKYFLLAGLWQVSGNEQFLPDQERDAAVSHLEMGLWVMGRAGMSVSSICHRHLPPPLTTSKFAQIGKASVKHKAPEDRYFWNQRFDVAERLPQLICFSAYLFIYLFLLCYFERISSGKHWLIIIFISKHIFTVGPCQAPLLLLCLYIYGACIYLLSLSSFPVIIPHSFSSPQCQSL